MNDQTVTDDRYARHFALSEVGLAGQARLNSARVLLIGVGGLGSPIALYLAAAGVGQITLVDPDHVSLSNLQRQVLFSTQDVGAPKVTRAETRLLDLNPTIKTTSMPVSIDAQNARELVRAHDIVIDGSDSFATRYCVNDACVLENKPLVFGALHKFEAQVSVLHFEYGPCYRCLYPEPPPVEAIPNCSETGVLGVLPGIAGTLMATEALKLILKIGEPLTKKLLHVDALTMSFVTRGFKRDQECAVCGDTPSITSMDAHNHHEVKGLSWKNLAALRERPDQSVHLIDVRNADEVLETSVDGFQNIPLPELSQKIAKVAWKPNDRLIVICKTGKRSARAVEILRQAGFHDVSHVEGGLSGRTAADSLS